MRVMVRTLDQVAAGEARASLLAKSMRSMVAGQMAIDGASEGDLAQVRMTPEAKKSLVDKMGAKREGRITEELSVSINGEPGVDSGSLLTGDSNEELRMQDRLAEKAQNAKEGKMARVTVDDLRAS